MMARSVAPVAHPFLALPYLAWRTLRGDLMPPVPPPATWRGNPSNDSLFLPISAISSWLERQRQAAREEGVTGRMLPLHPALIGEMAFLVPDPIRGLGFYGHVWLDVEKGTVDLLYWDGRRMQVPLRNVLDTLRRMAAPPVARARDFLPQAEMVDALYQQGMARVPLTLRCFSPDSPLEVVIHRPQAFTLEAHFRMKTREHKFGYILFFPAKSFAQALARLLAWLAPRCPRLVVADTFDLLLTSPSPIAPRGASPVPAEGW